MKNAFNMLLVSLLGFDSWFLVGTILENFRRNFGLGTNIHTLLFPQVLFPSLAVAMTGSIFMTVAISLERYFAVHHPIGEMKRLRREPLFISLTTFLRNFQTTTNPWPTQQPFDLDCWSILSLSSFSPSVSMCPSLWKPLSSTKLSIEPSTSAAPMGVIGLRKSLWIGGPW